MKIIFKTDFSRTRWLREIWHLFENSLQDNYPYSSLRTQAWGERSH